MGLIPSDKLLSDYLFAFMESFELGGRQVRNVFLRARVPAVEVAAIGQQFGSGN